MPWPQVRWRCCPTRPEPRTPRPGVPRLVVAEPRRLLGRLAAHVYGDPATAMRTIGVTGTQGKTTTTRLAEGGLERAGVRAGVIGTVGTRIAGEEVKTTLTTPEAPDLHALFAVMRERGVTACAMEVSSHALVMGRVDGVVFDVAVFLNLGRDHLDFHVDEEDYYRAKASLFTPERARLALVCVDDEHGRRLAGEATLPVRTFSVGGRDADWTVADLAAGPQGTTFRVLGPGVDTRGGVPLPGAFNVANALAAVAACGEAGLDAAAVAQAIAAGQGVPGRLERIEAGQPFTVVVDYAHKPDAVQAVLESLRPLTAGRLLVVLGAGGDRDPGKRPIMGGGGRAARRRRGGDRRQPADRERRRDPGRGARRRPDGYRRGDRGGRPPGGDRHGAGAGPARRHRGGGGEGPRDRSGGRRGRAPVRRPRRGARPAGDR